MLPRELQRLTPESGVCFGGLQQYVTTLLKKGVSLQSIAIVGVPSEADRQTTAQNVELARRRLHDHHCSVPSNELPRWPGWRKRGHKEIFAKGHAAAFGLNRALALPVPRIE